MRLAQLALILGEFILLTSAQSRKAPKKKGLEKSPKENGIKTRSHFGFGDFMFYEESESEDLSFMKPNMENLMFAHHKPSYSGGYSHTKATTTRTTTPTPTTPTTEGTKPTMPMKHSTTIRNTPNYLGNMNISPEDLEVNYNPDDIHNDSSTELETFDDTYISQTNNDSPPSRDLDSGFSKLNSQHSVPPGSSYTNSDSAHSQAKVSHEFAEANRDSAAQSQHTVFPESTDTISDFMHNQQSLYSDSSHTVSDSANNQYSEPFDSSHTNYDSTHSQTTGSSDFSETNSPSAYSRDMVSYDSLHTNDDSAYSQTTGPPDFSANSDSAAHSKHIESPHSSDTSSDSHAHSQHIEYPDYSDTTSDYDAHSKHIASTDSSDTTSDSAAHIQHIASSDPSGTTSDSTNSQLSLPPDSLYTYGDSAHSQSTVSSELSGPNSNSAADSQHIVSPDSLDNIGDYTHSQHLVPSDSLDTNSDSAPSQTNMSPDFSDSKSDSAHIQHSPYPDSSHTSSDFPQNQQTLLSDSPLTVSASTHSTANMTPDLSGTITDTKHGKQVISIAVYGINNTSSDQITSSNLSRNDSFSFQDHVSTDFHRTETNDSSVDTSGDSSNPTHASHNVDVTLTFESATSAHYTVNSSTLDVASADTPAQYASAPTPQTGTSHQGIELTSTKQPSASVAHGKQTVTKPIPPQASCKGYAQLCQRNEDCCSQRCIWMFHPVCGGRKL